MFGTRKVPKSRVELQPAGELQLFLALRLGRGVAGRAAAGIEDQLAVGEVGLVGGKLSRLRAAQARSETSRGRRRRSPRRTTTSAARRSMDQLRGNRNASWQALQLPATWPNAALKASRSCGVGLAARRPRPAGILSAPRRSRPHLPRFSGWPWCRPCRTLRGNSRRRSRRRRAWSAKTDLATAALKGTSPFIIASAGAGGARRWRSISVLRVMIGSSVAKAPTRVTATTESAASPTIKRRMLSLLISPTSGDAAERESSAQLRKYQTGKARRHRLRVARSLTHG